jgi:hypothetical protein
MSVANRVRVEQVTTLSNDWYVLKKRSSASVGRTESGRDRAGRPTTAVMARPFCSTMCGAGRFCSPGSFATRPL